MARKLKRMGVRAGWPDIVLLGPPGLHCLELKRLGEKLAEDQQLFEAFCIGIGVPYRWADNFDGALCDPEGVGMPQGQHQPWSLT